MNLLLPFSAHTLVFNSPKHDCFNAEFDTYTVKTRVFFELASIGSYINGVYCEIRLPWFLIMFLVFVKKKKDKTTCIGGCAYDTVLYTSLVVPCFT